MEHVDERDLEGLKIVPLNGGGFHVSVKCPLCRGIVALRLVGGDYQVEKECRSGGDWPKYFQLCVRRSPSEIDDPSGLKVWGRIGY